MTAIAPTSGSAGGQTAVTVNGDGFAENAVVLFGDVAGTKVVVVSAQQITCTTPPGAGAVDVRVLNPDFDITDEKAGLPYNYGRPWGLFGTLPASFTYRATPPSTGGPLDTEVFMQTVSGCFEEQASTYVDPDSTLRSIQR